MLRLVIGLAIGYVLGARSGRERYEQLVRFGSRVADNSAVQGVAGFARGQLGRLSSRSQEHSPDRRPDAAYLDDVDVPLTEASTGADVHGARHRN
jgi:hypothetical protein